MRIARFALVAPFALLSLGACTTVSETVRGPSLTPMGYPAALVAREQEVVPPLAKSGPASANSLWRNGARAFFIDQRAHRVGDILTVQIDIDDRAQTTNSSSSSRSSNTALGVPNFLGFESTIGKIFPSQFDPANAIETESNSSSAGAGIVQRQEKISLTVAATVAQVLPNGNMVIQGTQEVKTNNELRQLTVSGIVRPEDITAANTVRHTQIAEARINYGGRGDQSRVQRTPVGQALVERFTPF